MKAIFTRKEFALAVACALAFGVLSEAASAQAVVQQHAIVMAGECKDANNVKNVACMQPDRHVFVEVSGTRIAK